MLFHVGLRLFIEGLLHGVEQLGDLCIQLVEREEQLLAVVAPHGDALVVLDVLRADLDAQRHALHLPVGKLPAGGVVGKVTLDAQPQLGEPVHKLLRLFEHAGLMLRDGEDDDLNGGDLRRQDKAVVVAVRHDDRADHARCGAPGRLERILHRIVPAGERDVVGAGELVAEVVGRRALQRLVVLHHAFAGVGGFRTGELFLLGLAAGDDGDGENILKEVGVALELLRRLGLGLLGGLMDGVTLLPPELAAAQERTGRFLPADDGAPLVIEHRQLTVGVEHARPVVAEHRFARGAECERLLQLLAAALCDPCHLGGKAVDELAFLPEKALGDQNGHRHILMAGLFEFAVHDLLDVFPDRIAVGTQNGEALYRSVLHQLGLAADVGVPLSKIGLHIGDLLNQFFFRHDISPFITARALLPPRIQLLYIR